LTINLTKIAGPSASAAELRAHVLMLSEIFRPRDDAHPEDLERAALYIENIFKQNGAFVSRQRVSVNGNDYSNVSVLYGSASTPIIIIGTHYDAAGPLHDADDNASGVAGVLEISKLFREALCAIRTGIMPPKHL